MVSWVLNLGRDGLSLSREEDTFLLLGRGLCRRVEEGALLLYGFGIHLGAVLSLLLARLGQRLGWRLLLHETALGQVGLVDDADLDVVGVPHRLLWALLFLLTQQLAAQVALVKLVVLVNHILLLALLVLQVGPERHGSGRCGIRHPLADAVAPMEGGPPLEHSIDLACHAAD